jgi:anthranilate/para-aminobenzoate synthase component II
LADEATKRAANLLASMGIQAMQHQQRPLFGVQFHPELFNDEYSEGRRILENFLTV